MFYIHTNIHMHVYMYTCIHTNIYVYMFVCIHVCVSSSPYVWSTNLNAQVEFAHGQSNVTRINTSSTFCHTWQNVEGHRHCPLMEDGKATDGPNTHQNAAMLTAA